MSEGGSSSPGNREDFGAGVCREHGVFEVGGWLVIGGHHGPTVAQGSHLISAKIDHGFNRQRHPGFDFLTRVAAAEVGDLGLFMHFASDPMADHVAHYPRQRENLRLWLGDVLVATFHTVGPYNGADAATQALRDEHRVREAANAAWLRAAFELARQRGARALVLATQGDPLTRERRSDPWRVRRGFEGSIERTLVPLARAHRLPVLLVHGDSHQFRFDQPFTEPDGQPVGRLWRLQVFGDPQMHAVRVTVRPAQAPQPFDATPIWNPLSPDPRR